MIDTSRSREEFYDALEDLKPSITQNLLYIEENRAFLVAPLYSLANVDEARLEAESPQANESCGISRIEYFRRLTEEWASIIARAAIYHPYRDKILLGIHKALTGDLPDQPVWSKHVSRALITGDDDTIHLMPYSALTAKEKEGGRWRLSSAPATDLLGVLEALGYGAAPRVKPGPKSN
ncbi:hypothetical protein OAF99_02790 [Akkermansiaceae bacterium]|nr:hypothetical protein [Akkermansiaceae bacterium]